MDATGSSKVRVLITGVSGWVGQFVWQRLVQDYRSSNGPAGEDAYENMSIDLYGTYGNKCPLWIPSDRCLKLDVENEKSIADVLSETKPDIVLHMAAISFPDVCEKDQERGERVNNPSGFIQYIKTYLPNCFVIFTSSALVYDGEHAPYSPDFDTEAVPPICAYGRSKLKFENQVLTLSKSTVLRFSNVLGPSFVYKHGEFKFMEWLYTVFTQRKYLDFRHDEIRSFVYINDVVDLLSNLISSSVCSLSGSSSPTHEPAVDLSKVYGRRFNVGGPRGLSRLDIATLVAKSSGVDVQIGTENSISLNKSLVFMP